MSAPRSDSRRAKVSLGLGGGGPPASASEGEMALPPPTPINRATIGEGATHQSGDETHKAHAMKRGGPARARR